MRKPSRLRTGLAVAALALSTGGVIAAATPAFAAATGCSDLRVCMYLSTPSNGHVYVQGWADHVQRDGIHDADRTERLQEQVCDHLLESRQRKL